MKRNCGNSTQVDFDAAYLSLSRTGELKERVTEARRRLEHCDLCPNHCQVNRFKSIVGTVCQTGALAIVSSYGAHYGEERPLSGWNGSGTIFFSRCNLRCVFCQNWEISHKGIGREMTAAELASIMLQLERQGCHNINLVSPSHVVAPLLEAVEIAALNGLTVPLVYNTGGYDSLETLKLLDGVIDIYMPDMKYGSSDMAHRYSRAQDYAQVNQRAVEEMHRQVGDLILSPDGIALKGLLIRHLILPGEISNVDQVLRFIANKLSSNTYINLMDQYRPCYRAGNYPPLDRPLSRGEYLSAVECAHHLGLNRLD
ncbi:MAG TPA: radical SAM protein [Terriglobia bacterium]|nr:radical SAM protein [Terriglobia bacterium]